MNRLQYLGARVGLGVVTFGGSYLTNMPDVAPQVTAVGVIAIILSIAAAIYATYLRVKDVDYLNPGWMTFAFSVIPFIGICLLWERTGLMRDRRAAHAQAQLAVKA